jgi:tetratricopeptide (TPR) repeat protein
MKNIKHPEPTPSNGFINSTYYRYEIFGLILLVAALYIIVFRNSFTNWDDNKYIIDNPYLKSLSLENIKNMFTVFFEGNYHPLTLFSLAVDYQISGLDPWAYQMTNLILHLFNIWFVYRITTKLLIFIYDKSSLSYYIPLITATLFGIHTLQVESVAWVSEQKNVLYTFFFLSSLYMYLKYQENFSVKCYIYSLFLFLGSLLSKGTAVSLSLCIIGVDCFLGHNLVSKKVIMEKIPFLLLSVIFGCVAIVAQRSGGAIWTGADFSWFERIALAGYGFIQYFFKLCYPFHLSAFYPYPFKPEDGIPIEYYGFAALALLLIAFVWFFFRKNKIVWSGFLFFVINIIMVLQLVPVGKAIMADRYIYVPSIGFFFIIGYLIHWAIQKYSGYKKIIISLFALYCIVLGMNTFDRLSVWKNSLTLWNDALSKFPENNDNGYLNRANFLYKNKNFDEALNNYTKVIEINPQSAEAFIGIGLIKKENKDIRGALANFNNAIYCRPTYEGYINRASIRMILKDFANAMDDLDKAYQMDPLRLDVYSNKGFIYLQTGKYEEALKNFSKAIEIDAGYYNAYLGMGRTKQALNDLQGAISFLNTALQLSKTSEAYICRADVKIALGDAEGARTDLDNAMQLEPDKPDIYINKGMLELKLGNINNAFMEYNKAVALNRKNYQAYLYRAIAKYSINEFRDAVADLDTSIYLSPNATSYYYRAMAYIRLGRKDAGCDDLHQSVLLENSAAQAEIRKNCK